MAVVKSIPVKKFMNGEIVEVSEHTFVSDPTYTTTGEYATIIDDVEFCEITLDHTNTTHIVIKSLTNAKILPMEGKKIDRLWDDIVIGKGACVELKYILHNWYILSSDGLKTS